jgi:hypothetical protein
VHERRARARLPCTSLVHVHDGGPLSIVPRMAHLAARTRCFSIALALAAAAAPARAQTPTAAAQPAAPAAPDAARYGVGIRMPRWVTIPDWFLGAFLAESVPLSTFASYGLEFIRRKPGFDIVLGLSYQNMSPGDGNWLGKGKDPSIDTDFVQFRGLSLLGVDAAFVGRRSFGPYVGLRYGAGLGLAIVRGELLRTSSAGCTAANAGDTRACRPTVCRSPGGCTEPELAASEGDVDGGPGDPSRFAEPNVPGAVPVLNLSLGLDFHLPSLPGAEARLEGGFYNAFFLGLAFSYIF